MCRLSQFSYTSMVFRQQHQRHSTSLSSASRRNYTPLMIGLLLTCFLGAGTPIPETATQSTYVFHVVRGNREETLHGYILEEGARHYRVYLDYPWQESNRTRNIYKNDLSGKPVLELRGEREERLKKGWDEFFEARGEVNLGTIDDPKPFPKSEVELADRARQMALAVDEARAASFPAPVAPSDTGMPASGPSEPSEPHEDSTGARRVLAAGIILVAAVVIVLILRSMIPGRA